jgi:hypothetical protein
MKRNLLFLLCLLFVCIATGQSDPLQKIIDGRRNSIEQQQKPYVILISADGFPVRLGVFTKQAFPTTQ